jgi:hypothetical protein
MLKNKIEKQEAAMIAEKLGAPLDAHGSTKMAGYFLQGGYGQDGYGVPEGAAINGSFAFKGNQGYYTKEGKKIFLNTVKNMKDFFERRKPVKLVIKSGIGGQHTPFQGIADIFKADKSVKICGEYELGKDYEGFITETLKELEANWDEVAVIPSSKSGSTDETMMIFTDIFYVLLKHQAMEAGINGEKFASVVFNTLCGINFIDGKERPGKDLFKTASLIDLISEKTTALNISRAQVKDIFAKVLGNMFFETTDRVDQSRLSAFIRNSGLDKELGIDAPGFGAMFDNVGGRWTGDLHMMTFLAYYGLNAEEYWEIREKGIIKVREGNHAGNVIGNKILDEVITDIALVVPDEFFWFGKSNEQNFNESIWQDGFANLIAISESRWSAQEQHYANNPKKLVINMAGMDIAGDLFNVFKVDMPDFSKLDNQCMANAFAELFTLFYGMTNTVGNRLIARALNKAGYGADDVDLNDVNNPATKIVQQNLFLRQPYVELGKGLLEKRLKALQEKEYSSPGAMEADFESIKKLARQGRIETNISGLNMVSGITNKKELSDIMSKVSEFAKKNGRKFVPFVYLEGDKFYDLRDYLISLGTEWVMQGTGDQHISYQQVLAQPKKYLLFIVSLIPEKYISGKPAIGFAKGYLHNISPNMARDLFAEASYKALTESRKDQGGMGLFLRIVNSEDNINIFKQAVKSALK